MDVLFAVMGDEQVASTRYRVLNILPHLTDIDYNLFSLADFKSGYSGSDRIAQFQYSMELLRKARKYDVVFIQKLVLPPTYFGFLTGAYFHLLRNAAGRLIYDMDDAQYTGQHGDATNKAMKKKVDSILQQTDTVIAGSEGIGEYTERFADTYILPSALPKEEYRDRCADVTANDPVRMGWIGNPENLYYLRMYGDMLRRILNQNNSLELHIVTDLSVTDQPLNDRGDVVYHQWSRSEELDYLSSFQFAIRPLTNDEWTRAKGGFLSVIQYMALNLPVVVTPVGALRNVVKDGESGFHAESDEEWRESIQSLTDDPQLRKRMGNNAFARINSLNRWSENYATNLQEVITKTA